MAAASAPNHMRAPGAVLRRALSAKLSLQTRWVPRIEVEDVLREQGGAMVRGSGCETPSGAAAVLDVPAQDDLGGGLGVRGRQVGDDRIRQRSAGMVGAGLIAFETLDAG